MWKNRLNYALIMLVLLILLVLFSKPFLLAILLLAVGGGIASGTFYMA